VLKKAEEEHGMGYKNALEYDLKRKIRGNKIPLENLIELFQAYERANHNGQKLSLEELGDISGISLMSSKRILKTAGLKPMYGSWNKKSIPESKKQSIRKAFYLDLPVSDIADILNVPSPVINQTWCNMRKTQDEPQIKNNWIKRFELGSSNRTLTYRLANKIYEEQDLGFNGEEIDELLDTTEEVRTYALSHKESIEAKRNEVMEAIKC